MYIYKSLSKFNETLRLNRYEKSLSPLCFCTAYLENFVINQEQNLFSRNHLPYFHYVIKELVHAFSSAYIELWMYLGSLESTQASLTLLSCSSNFPRASITRYTHAKHEPILNFQKRRGIEWGLLGDEWSKLQ